MKKTNIFFRCQRGVVSIEFAFVGLLLIVLTIGLIEIGRALFMMNELSHAADRASRVVLLNFSVGESELRDAVVGNFLISLMPESLSILSPAPATGASFRVVELEYEFTPLISDFIIDSLVMSVDRRIAR